MLAGTKEVSSQLQLDFSVSIGAGMQGRCTLHSSSSPSAQSAGERADPAPCLRTIVELALMAKAQMRNPEGMRESRRVDPASWQLQSPVS